MNPMVINGQEINVGPATKYILFLDGKYEGSLTSFDSALPGVGECFKIEGLWFEIDRFDDDFDYVLHIVECVDPSGLEQNPCLEVNE